MRKTLLPLLFLFFYSSCIKSNDSKSVPDPDGNWEVFVVASGHCLAPAGSKIITVSGGSFNATIMTYTNGGCSQSLKVAGTITAGNLNYVVSGNETISGNCCNGSNGFYANIDPNTGSGTVSSNWGDLRFVKK